MTQANLQISGDSLLPKGYKLALRKLLKSAIVASGVEQFVSLAFVDESEMTALNRMWRGKSKPTDVLSFAAQEGEHMPGLDDVLGDLVICVPVALEQASEFGHGFDVEISVLFVHGLAHLLGFDHERGDDDARTQAEWEMQILSACNLDPTLALLARNFEHN